MHVRNDAAQRSATDALTNEYEYGWDRMSAISLPIKKIEW